MEDKNNIPPDFAIFLGNLGELHSLRDRAKGAIESRGSEDKLVVQIRKLEKQLNEYILNDAEKEKPDWYKRTAKVLYELVRIYRRLTKGYQKHKPRKLVLD